MKKPLHNILFFLIALGLFACNKYEYGPSVSLRTKKTRISNSWVVETSFINGVEQTTLPRHELIIDKSGSVEKFDTLLNTTGADSIVAKTGLWEFDRKAENLILLFADNIGVQEARIWRILKLTSTEFWYEERDSLNLIEVHLKEKIL